MSTRLLLIRHGETPATVERLFVGSTNVELTPGGHEQARAVAQRLKHVRIDALYVSPLTRCMQTAAPIVETTGLRPRVDGALRECDFGSWEGMSFQEVFQKDPDGLRRWVTEEGHSSHGGESREQLADRVWAWWLAAAVKHENDTVCAVTHGGPIRSAVQRGLQAPFSAFLSIEIDPASITLLQTQGPGVRVRFVNETSHLGDPLRPSEPPTELPP